MSQETRHINALDVNNVVTWTNDSNAYTEDDNYANSSDIDTVGYFCGGNYQDSQGTPTALDLFQIRFFDIGSEHIDDTFDVQIYNPHTTAWETLESFTTGNLLPTSLTTKTYTTVMQTKFNAASDKSAFLDGLQVRLYMSAKGAGPDRVNMGLAWSKFTYTYSDTQLYYETVTAVGIGTGVETSTSKRFRDVVSTGAGSPVVSRALDLGRSVVATSVGDALAAKQMFGEVVSTALAVAGSVEQSLHKRAVNATALGSAVVSRTLSLGRTVVAVAIGIAQSIEDLLGSVLPDRDDVLTMDYSKIGRPFVLTAAKTGIDLDGLDYSRTGSPWWGIEAEGAALHYITATAVGLAIAISDRGLTLGRAIISVAIGNPLVSRVLDLGRSVNATSVGDVLATKKMFGHVDATGIGGALAAKKLFNAIISTAIGSAIVFRTLAFGRTVVATVIGTASAAKKMFDISEAVATGAALIDKGITYMRSVIATAVGFATVIQIGLGEGEHEVFVVATANGVAAISRKLDYYRTVVSSAIGVPVVHRLLALSRSVQAIAYGATEAAKQLFHTVTVVAVATPIVIAVKSLQRLVIATAIAIAVVTRQLDCYRNVAAIAIGIAGVTLIESITVIAQIAQGTASSAILKTKNFAADILASINIVPIFELQNTSSSGGDEARGIPSTKIVKKHRLKPARIMRNVLESWIVTGIAKIGDSTLTTAERLIMTNRIRQGNVIYDIIKELKANTAVGTLYQYIIRRSPLTDPNQDIVALQSQPKTQKAVQDILGIMNTDSIHEIQITSESDGDRARGIPSTKVIKRHKVVSARILETVEEEWITTGLANKGDLTLITGEQLNMRNEVESQGIRYAIIQEIEASTHVGIYYLYIIRRNMP